MNTDDLQYLRSRQRRGKGRWFHYYRRDEKEIPLGVHGLHPTDPRVFAAYCAAHARWEEKPPTAEVPKGGSFAWAVEIYQATADWKTGLKPTTKKQRSAIYRRYIAKQGGRPIANITRDDIETGLKAKGGSPAVQELKALRPVFAHAHDMKLIPVDPTFGLKMKRPKSKGFPTVTAEEIEAFQARWPIGTTERLAFDLGLLIGAARVDLVRLSRKNERDGILTYIREKTGTTAQVPVTPELRTVISRTPDIAPAFLLTSFGKPFSAAGFGNFFGDAAKAAGMKSRLHGLRKGFCVFCAEKGATTSQIAAMAGHLTLSEVERYTRAADRTRMVRLLVRGA